ncbi:ImmA/IrrE family metallo-endopeptidase, partial [PVC group bacterium]|nr:ImmA/IrrE family metallo-endopeptidase [PVC group bacterium]
MSNSMAVNLRRYRKLRHLTQDDIAGKVGISRVAYRNIETGKAEPRPNTLDALAIALGVDAFSLIGDIPKPQSLRFRSRKTLSVFEKAEREEEIIETLNWLTDFNELEEILDEKPHCSIRSVRKRRSEIPDFAEKVRKDKFDIDCDECIPNICDLLEQNGVKVRVTEAHIKSFFGFSVGPKDGGPAVVVNRLEPIPVERQIFTAAHELGHLFLHQTSYKPEETGEKDDQEKDANIFASYFLMPEDQFYEEWERNRGLHWVDRVLKTKRTFRVSWMTVLYRLCEDEYADNSIYAKFRKSYELRTGKKFKYEPEDELRAASRRRAEEPAGLNRFDFYEDRFSSLVRDALREDKISVSRAAG